MANIKVETQFGELSIDPAQIITFPRGVPGFEKCTKWTLFHEIDDQGNLANAIIVHLQSMDDGDVSLPLTDPVLFGFNFNLMLTDSETAELEIDDSGDVIVLVTLSVKSDAPLCKHKQVKENIYANISAPFLINTKSKIGIQKILADNGS
ncbi:MAG: flagellar assembly protein FliW [Gallionella sp.]|nr:flagellar assembly protein FliW [Gallionella sp.]